MTAPQRTTDMTDQTKHYARRDLLALGDHFSRHMLAMTAEDLHRKSAIAAELAWRDAEIERLNVALSASAPAAGSVPSDVDKKRIAHNAHVQCSLIPGATFYNAAEAAIDALLAQYGNPAWQPIETAPKDGTTILIGRDMRDFGFVRGYGRFEGTDGAYISGWVSSGFIDPPGNLGLAHPTHWMPLPPAPQEGK